MKKKDPSKIQEAKLSTKEEVNFRIAVEKYFENSTGSTVEKLHNFPKYVPRQRLAKFISRYELFKKVLNVQGSIVECGVYLGGGLMTFAQLSAIFEPVNYQRKIIGFDTFSGFAPLSKEDATGTSEHSKEGGFARDSYEDLKRCVELYDSNRFLSHVPKVSLVKGDIAKTAPKYIKDNPGTVVSLLYLDVDVFGPTKVAIENFLPRMPKGSIIVFDELNSEKWPGETLAVLETIGLKNIKIERFSHDSVLSFAVIE